MFSERAWLFAHPHSGGLLRQKKRPFLCSLSKYWQRVQTILESVALRQRPIPGRVPHWEVLEGLGVDARLLGKHEAKGNVEQEWVCSSRRGFKLVLVQKVACKCRPAPPGAFFCVFLTRNRLVAVSAVTFSVFRERELCGLRCYQLQCGR